MISDGECVCKVSTAHVELLHGMIFVWFITDCCYQVVFHIWLKCSVLFCFLNNGTWNPVDAIQLFSFLFVFCPRIVFIMHMTCTVSVIKLFFM